MSAINLEVLKGEKLLLQAPQSVASTSLADLMASIKTVKERSNEFLTELVTAEKTKQTERLEAEQIDEDEDVEEEHQTIAQDLSCKKQKLT